MKVPSFKSKKIREDIFEVVEQAPTREMYDAVMRCIDDVMEKLMAIREEIKANGDVKKMLKQWDKAYTAFGEREAYYYQAIVEGEDRSIVDAPLFKGDYKGFDFEKTPSWPDIETPWRMANDLSTAAVAAGEDQDYLDDLEEAFKAVIEDFWSNAHELIEEQRVEAEALATQEAEGAEGEGRVYGFIPIVIAGAAALAAGLGVAAGYTVANKKNTGEYVESKPLEKHLKTAKTVGIGIAIGVVIALLFILRIRR